jgi:hypothetical protein
MLTGAGTVPDHPGNAPASKGREERSMQFTRRRAMALAAGAAALAFPARRAAAADPAKVGAIFPLSGGAGPQG